MKINRLIASIAAFLLFASSIVPARALPADSLVIRFANQTRLVIYAPTKAGIQALTAYDLNKIVRDMGLKLDSLPNGQTAVRLSEQQGERYLKDTVLIITRNNGKVRVVIRNPSSRTDTTDNGGIRNTRDVVRAVKDSIRVRRNRNTLNRFFTIQLGVNGWSDPSGATTYKGGPYELRPLGSRYFAFAIGQRPVLASNGRTSLSLYYGLEAVWQNYMFENNVVARKSPSDVSFVDPGLPLEKSKLTNFSLQVPVVPRVTFYTATGRRAFYIGLGGFIGYRLDSYTRALYANGNNNREFANFYQDNLRYGLVAHVGLRKLNLFAKYELTPVFQPGKGPDLRSYSFGITL